MERDMCRVWDGEMAAAHKIDDPTFHFRKLESLDSSHKEKGS